MDFWCSVVVALLLPYHPLYADLVPYLTVNEEFQEQKSPNKETSTVHGETDKEKEREEDRKVLTSFTDVAGPKKDSSDVQKSNRNHSLHFGMVQNGTHAQTLFILQCTKMTVIPLICFHHYILVLLGNIISYLGIPGLPARILSYLFLPVVVSYYSVLLGRHR